MSAAAGATLASRLPKRGRAATRILTPSAYIGETIDILTSSELLWREANASTRAQWIVARSPRECEALSWPAEGKTVADIAVLMKISPEAVKAHLDSARRPTVTWGLRYTPPIGG
ncbi:MAG: helix-turn-helix domain-containing protein [Roseiarcus sp.]